MLHSDFDLIFQNQLTESKIVVALERISQAFKVLLWQESLAYNLTPIQVQILLFLKYQHPSYCTVSYLAAEFNLSKPTISDTIKTLVQKKLITKTIDPNDSRSYTVQLNEEGDTVAEKTSLFSKEIFKPIEKLNENDKENLLLNLLDIIRQLHINEVITIQRMCYSCSYFKSDGSQNFCNLLHQRLENKDLRVDCAEHNPLPAR